MKLKERNLANSSNNQECCYSQRSLTGASDRGIPLIPFFWTWKPRLREHETLAKGHVASKWWAQDPNLGLTESTPLHSLCGGRLQGRDCDGRRKNTNNRWTNEKRTFSFTWKRPQTSIILERRGNRKGKSCPGVTQM